MLIVHAADIHLDSPLRGLPEYEGAPLGEVRGATRRAFANLIRFTVEEEAKLLLLAGDLYDGDFRDYSTALFLTEELARLREVGTKVVWIRGNHDAENRITRHLRLPEGCYELKTAAPESRVFEDLGIVVHGQGYATSDLREDLASAYPKPRDGYFNVGLLHTALDGRAGHGSYAPCSSGQLDALGYQYWALGHVHQREVIEGVCPIVFPGNLQGRHIRETGPKGATVLSLDGGRLRGLRAETFDVVRWECLRVDVSDCSRFSDVLDLVGERFARAREGADGRTLALRVELFGASRAHSELVRRSEELTSALRREAIEQGEIYLEEVKMKSSLPGTGGIAERGDAVAGLLRRLEEQKREPETIARLLALVEDQLSNVPQELRDGPLAEFALLYEEVLRDLGGRLTGPGEEREL